MRVLILSITAGEGHNSTGKALAEYLLSLGIDTQFLDTYQYISHNLAKMVSDGYQISTKYATLPYSAFYRLFETRKKNADDASITSIVNTVMAPKLLKYINHYMPDVILCTHCFAASVVDKLKQQGKIMALTVGIVTDFTIHPFWEESIHFDYLVLANELLDAQALKKGFHKQQLLDFGIPIHTKFSNQSHKKEAVRARLGLAPDKKTFLIMSGSMGFGNLTKTIKSIENVPADLQYIVVCGTNAQAKEHLDQMSKQKQNLVFGFVHNIDELMDSADCIITKPGGLTSSEALAKGLPMILVDPIPGQEDRNVEFLLNSGVAMNVTATCPLDEVVYQFLINPKRQQAMRECVRLIAKPRATQTLCDFVLQKATDKVPRLYGL